LLCSTTQGVEAQVYLFSTDEIPRDQILLVGTWKNYPVPAGSGVAEMGWNVDDTIKLTTSESCIGVNLLRHDWSGIVKWSFAGKSGTIDLYSEAVDYNKIDWFENASGKPATLEIRLTDMRNEASQSNQCWLVGVAFERRPSWLPRVTSVSMSTQIIRGYWGDFIAPAKDTIISKQIAATGCWAEKDVELFQQWINPGMNVVDIGANIGHHTVVFSKLVGPKGRVLAVEAQQLLSRIVQVNAFVNGLRNVEVLHAALGHKKGVVHMNPVDYFVDTNFGSLGLSTEKKDGEAVTMVRLTDVMNDPTRQDMRIGFIKMDIQGSELFALKGARDILKRDRPIIFSEISPVQMKNAGYDYREVYAFLNDLSYDILHPSDPDIAAGGIKKWQGGNDEWDVLAVPRA
jgi:FkbM family methyltransferase